jgi:hypothetical protein
MCTAKNHRNGKENDDDRRLSRWERQTWYKEEAAAAESTETDDEAND